MEFPNMAAAQNWYNSSDYQRILHLRVVISDLILVDGVSPDCSVADLARQIRAARKAAA